MAIYTCVICGKQFEATQRAKYCTQACKAYAQNHKRIKVQCIVCGKIVETTKQHPAKFCSPLCHQKAVTDVTTNPDSPYVGIVAPRKAPAVVQRVCIDCGCTFDTKGHSVVNRRCPDCAHEYKRLWGLDAKGLKTELASRKHKPSEIMEVVDAYFDKQGIEVETPEPQLAKSEAQTYKEPNQTREEYNAKRRATRAKKKALGLLAAEDHDRTGYRKKTIEAKGAVCSCCGYSAFEDAIQVHHLDLDRENNDMSNLVVLCANCHVILHKRIKRKFSLWQDKKAGCLNEYYSWQAEVKRRNEAGKPDRATRTEGCEESQSGATRSSRSRTDIRDQETALFEIDENGNLV